MLLDTKDSTHGRTMVALTSCSASGWSENKKCTLLLDKEMSLTKAQPCPVEVQLCSQKCLEKCVVELCAQFASDLPIHCAPTCNDMPVISHLPGLHALPQVLRPYWM